MNYLIVIYISVVLRIRFAACAGFANFPFSITQDPPTAFIDTNRGDAEYNLFYNALFNHRQETSTAAQYFNFVTTPMPTTSEGTSSQSLTSATPTFESVATGISKEKQSIIRENKRRCNKLPHQRLISTCRAIVEESLRDTDYLYVTIDDEDNVDLVKQLGERVASQGKSLLYPLPIGEQPNCWSLTCPTTDDWLNGTIEEDRSTSPWSFCDNYDPDRIPSYVSIAKCLCKGCKERNMEGENINFASVEIQRHMRVIRKHHTLSDFSACTNSKLCWSGVESFPVGCHCVVPR